MARSNGLTVRPVGSGHSWSDVALTTGYLVAPQGLTGVEWFDPDAVRAGIDPSRLVSVRSGTTLHEVNGWLECNGLGLIQMGGYDGQTLAGAVATSTHGSGIAFGPFPDYIRSIDLIDGTGQRRRIEPADGPSDPQTFRRPGWVLNQDDEWFRAVACGMGCMGLILSLVIEVRERFELTEVRRLSTWSEVRDELLAGEPGRHEHYEFYINPYAREGPGSNRCIVTTRAQETGAGGPRHRPVVPELLGHLPWVTAGVMRLAADFAPSMIPRLLDFSLSAIKCPAYTNVSYLVFNIGSANNLRVYSAEMSVPTAGDRHVEAVERVIATAERYRKEGTIYHTSPVAQRFVAPSDALMSMMHKRETMTIELIQMVDTDGGMEILAAHEEALAELDVRPHWGQINTLACGEALAELYPGLEAWQAVREQLDPHGVFASPFTKRVGLTPRGVSS
jgi:FAD/FMN-containing dehydrogenase